MIEKHFTDDKSRPGPDHSFALEVEEFAAMALHIRQLEEAMTGRTKTFRPAERAERIMARRAVYAAQPIKKGTPIRREMVNIVRHAYPEGIPANQWETIQGLKASRDIEKGELITWEMI
jgi:sialic acid synthase SpsE